MRKLSLFCLLSAVVLMAVLLSGCGKDSGETVSAESVALITGYDMGALTDSYAGKVVSGETAKVRREADRTIETVYVEEGDMVEAGDILFSYDVEAMQLDLDKLQLELENLQNTITAAEEEISQLQTQQAKATTSSDRLNYTLQINTRQADIREANYNIALKEKEIANMQTEMENTDIIAPITGRVMSVGAIDSSDTDGGSSTDSSDAFITIMDVSNYRVEGKLNEQNANSLSEGMRVIVRSRLDSEQVWYGVIDSIDWKNPSDNSTGDSYYGNSDSGNEMTNSSVYPFYVLLDDPTGLLMGQHVYIEPDVEVQEGLWLPAYYIEQDDNGSYVWAAADDGTIEKRVVELGGYDEMTDCYEILSGLDYQDYIAYPDGTIAEGTAVVYYDESVLGLDESTGGDVTYEYTEDLNDDTYYEDYEDDGSMYYAEGEEAAGAFYEDDMVAPED